MTVHAQEEDLRRLLGLASILRQRRKGVGRPLPLAELRRAHQAAPILPDERETTAADHDEMTNEGAR
ncbi:hypothetical protein [Streptomyces sp. NPDC021608]|uniref:hypothetical protein n=1 Tax=Streptomyces sp. NPDC021608 TaxID=3154903 RepID=UPI0034009E7E